MKKLFLGSVALVALGLGAPAAFAAERAVPAYAPPPPPAPVYTWSGCYAGANAGYSNGRSTQTTVANSVLTGGGLGVPAPAPLALAGGGVIAPVPAGTSIAGDLNLSGFIGGFQGGCNYQFGQWVVGAEVDGMANNKEGQNFEVGLVPFLGNGRANWVSQTQERWLVTARGKLGMTWWDKSMVYVTGGAAWAKIDTSEFLIGAQTGTGHQESNTRTGWTVGAGYEYALGYGWSIKGEYLYVKFDDYTTFTQPPFGGAGLNIAPRTNKLNDNIFRAGMNYKIGWY
jgi:outer membrane immunogenic protein